MLLMCGNTAEVDKKLLQCSELVYSSTYIIIPALGKSACLFLQESLSPLFFHSSVLTFSLLMFFSVKYMLATGQVERVAWLSGQRMING